MKFEEYLNEKKVQVEARLHELFEEISGNFPEELAESMKYSLFAGGKRLRPILVYAATDVFGGELNDALTVGAGLEFIHTYSLIHDDLPSMDDDDYRRGKLTNHKVFGEATAVLAGDALLTEAFNILTCKKFYKKVNANVLLDISNYIAVASGGSGMVAGQILDMAYENRNIPVAELEKIHLNKTAKLITAALYSGARLATDNRDVLNKMESFGINIGLCFQIVDDILDVTGDFEQLGKSVGSDQKKKKATYPMIFGIEGSKKIAVKLMEESVKNIDFLNDKGNVLKYLAEFIIDRVY